MGDLPVSVSPTCRLRYTTDVYVDLVHVFCPGYVWTSLTEQVAPSITDIH